MFRESVSDGLNISTNSLGESVPSRSYMISVINICWENAIDWRKKIIEIMRLMDTFIRWFILLLSYRKINYGSSGVKKVGIVSIRLLL